MNNFEGLIKQDGNDLRIRTNLVYASVEKKLSSALKKEKEEREKILKDDQNKIDKICDVHRTYLGFQDCTVFDFDKSVVPPIQKDYDAAIEISTKTEVSFKNLWDWIRGVEQVKTNFSLWDFHRELIQRNPMFWNHIRLARLSLCDNVLKGKFYSDVISSLETDARNEETYGYGERMRKKQKTSFCTFLSKKYSQELMFLNQYRDLTGDVYMPISDYNRLSEMEKKI